MSHILLLGDSLTEWGFECGWASRLSNVYVRRADVINRGLCGYNTRWILSILKNDESRHHLLPAYAPRPLFITLLLGSNDCATGGQAVPLHEFKSNLRAIIDLVRKHASPVGGIFLMTPPPINVEKWHKRLQREFGADPSTCGRSLERVLSYRDAVLQVGCVEKKAHNDVHVVDLYERFLGKDAESPNVAKGPWCDYLSDGLHFSETGGALVFDALMSAIESSPHSAQIIPGNVATQLPDFMTLMK
ncbi:esterase, putative [Trypanosoma equiperdum]|uniref:Esterase, putative n=4 Tax=Trypanozoon TaxID=39700 RepID=Q586T2_TRYB2|nr:esterase, putative [Trypanosoma brucei gambiense DAL972]XP_951670.1 esterase, putative [Trypanosoma brucei brucei TREU927]AAX80154.1 esterase, putative [Trypanosoma brucei]RHW74010.1 esterase [Trypanosoma brucei equiperdum]SCU65381.1 esterase, putative [Trypanosoma equiperdum]AAQ15951.1 esterase, putative [Trypanosoma brucei brucei TREU927]CBH09550.1 esterase, putative [Trypanosoma brucei gambiense DAL972]|eukprot:XP_011771855.1 esterase, putative [Trypanosoma brucei gambiense DAL972]